MHLGSQHSGDMLQLVTGVVAGKRLLLQQQQLADDVRTL